MDIGNKILKETESINVADYTIGGKPLTDFLQAINQVDISSEINNSIYDRMRTDSTISTVLDMYVSDALTRDPHRNRMCWVEIHEEGHTELERELEAFLYEHINIEEALRIITPRLISYGAAPVQLGFTSATEVTTNFLAKVKNESTASTFKEFQKQRLVENQQDRRTLMEDKINIKKKQYLGQWYLDYVPNTSQIAEIKVKGKTVAYINNDPEDQIILNADNVAGFIHYTDTSSTSMYSINDEGEFDLFYINSGTSYLKNAATAYQVLSAFEDLLLMHAMTTAISYRIFSVEVGALDGPETTKLLTDLKTRIRNNESIDLKNTMYSSSLSGIPLGDSIFIPVRNEMGSIKVDSIKNDFGIRDIADFEYFKNKLAVGLRVPPALLGFSTEQPSGLGAGSSLTRHDIRYSRMIDSIKSELASGVQQIIERYLNMTRSKVEYELLPKITVKFAKTNSADEIADLEAQGQRMSGLDKIIESLQNLGIDVSKYPETRNEIIKQFCGSLLAKTIAEDEEKNQGPEEVVNVSSSSIDIQLEPPAEDASAEPSPSGIESEI